MKYYLFIFIICFLSSTVVIAQNDGPVKNINGINSNTRSTSQNRRSKTDTSIGFKHRDDLKDSITINYRYLDSLKSNKLDSSLDDFNRFFSIPAGFVTLGNNGSPAFPILFSPILKAGWDEGMHQFDLYRFNLETTKFFRTTKPYSELRYILASGKEQLVNILHTQNINQNWNFGFEYRLISAPGFFVTQNTSHNNYRLFSNYQGKRKRYNAYFVVLGNKLKASENGGIRDDKKLDSSDYSKRFTIPVNLGGDAPSTQNVFSTKVSTGNLQNNFTFFLRQSYDLGKKDSIEINDSTKEYLFYSKLRFQHTFSYKSYNYQFVDSVNLKDSYIDSSIFKKWYDTALDRSNGIKLKIEENWKIISNDFSIKQFPETKNPAQFLEAGVQIENLTHTIPGVSKKNFYNLIGHGEYRNKTRNKKWDGIAKGELYLNGLNGGDFNVQASLKRYLNLSLGDIEINFQNVNRTPSYIYNDGSAFNLEKITRSKKENIVLFSFGSENPKFSLWARNMWIANYSYFKNYYQTDQSSSLINLTQGQLSKRSHLRKHIFLYSDFTVQKIAGSQVIHVPLFYTRQRIVLEGTYFKNLNLVTGFDINYNTPYKENNYSPLNGQFVPQDSSTISNRPNVSYFLNFRIKSFRAIIKLENLNTIDSKFGFTRNNFAAPHYPTNGLVFRLGVVWSFVN